MPSRKVSFSCKDLTLEGVVDIPENADRPLPGAVVCHPHPLYGGNMYNNVTSALSEGLPRLGIAVLRFNFRGTGGSQGSHGEGLDEVEDVTAAFDYLEKLEEVDSTRMLLAGYSFGCWIGLSATAQDPRAGLLIGISPPVNMYDFSFLNQETRPKLLIAGDNDFVCSVQGFKKLGDDVPEPRRIVSLPGVDHFHGGSERFVMEEIEGFLDEHPMAGK